MDPRASYLLVALQKGRAHFLERFSNGFLVRRGRGTAEPPAVGDEDESISHYHTALYDTAKVQRGAVSQKIAPSRWVVAAVERRADSPYQDRISVGRTHNCDVTLRFATVSKRHAHFWCDNGAVTQLADNQSANGTFVNGERIAPRARVPVKFGDRVRFGDLELEYLSAEAFYELIAPPGAAR